MAEVKVTPGSGTSTDLKFRGGLDWARAVPNGTVKPATSSAAAIVRAAILRFLIFVPLFSRKTPQHLTVSRPWPLFTTDHFRGTLQRWRKTVNSRRISSR